MHLFRDDMGRKRFQIIIAEVLGPDAGFGATPSFAQLEAAAKQLGDSDVSDIRDTLDELALELESVPDWDGDTQDDIFRAKTTLEKLLRLTQGDKLNG